MRSSLSQFKPDYDVDYGRTFLRIREAGNSVLTRCSACWRNTLLSADAPHNIGMLMPEQGVPLWRSGWVIFTAPAARLWLPNNRQDVGVSLFFGWREPQYPIESGAAHAAALRRGGCLRTDQESRTAEEPGEIVPVPRGGGNSACSFKRPGESPGVLAGDFLALWHSVAAVPGPRRPSVERDRRAKRASGLPDPPHCSIQGHLPSPGADPEGLAPDVVEDHLEISAWVVAFASEKTLCPLGGEARQAANPASRGSFFCLQLHQAPTILVSPEGGVSGAHSGAHTELSAQQVWLPLPCEVDLGAFTISAAHIQ